jgi:hypothetical protein
MLPSVPGGTVSDSLPATTTRLECSGCIQTSCDPRWRTTRQPAAINALRTSPQLAYIAIAPFTGAREAIALAEKMKASAEFAAEPRMAQRLA